MSDPQRWQLGHPTYPSLPYANQPQQSQQPGYQPELNMYDPSLQQQQQQLQQASPLPPLRPLQPSPYPAAGYPVYPYPRNNAKSVSTEELEGDKADNRRTRISRAWYYILFHLSLCNALLKRITLYTATHVEEKK